METPKMMAVKITKSNLELVRAALPAGVLGYDEEDVLGSYLLINQPSVHRRTEGPAIFTVTNSWANPSFFRSRYKKLGKKNKAGLFPVRARRGGVRISQMVRYAPPVRR